MEKLHLQITLSDAGESNFKRLVVFCTEKEREDVDGIQEAFSRSPQKSTRRASVQSGVPHTTVWRAVHNSLHLNAYKSRLCRLENRTINPDNNLESPRIFNVL
jgi:hypothetical protein